LLSCAKGPASAVRLGVRKVPPNCELRVVEETQIVSPEWIEVNPAGSVTSNETTRATNAGGLIMSLTIDRSSGLSYFGLGVRAICFDDNLYSIFHRIFEGHLDSEQSVLVSRFGFDRFHRPT